MDETYRDVSAVEKPPLAAAADRRALSVSSMSKAYGLPGIRIGWVVTRETRLPIARWPAALGPLHIVALADLHTHNPDVFVHVPARVLLTLAGHTHGGQVNLPVLGRLIVPSQFGERFAIGHVQEDGRDLFVTPGIGTSIVPVRFGVRPEISVLTVDR